MSESVGQSETARRLLTLTRLRCRRLALWMDHLWQTNTTSPDQGQVVTSSEVARLLQSEKAQQHEATFFSQGEPATLTEQVHDAAAERDADIVWRSITDTFSLTQEETDLLSLLIAAELDPGLSRVLAYLHDDTRLAHATPWLSARLAIRHPAPFDTSNLRRWLLAAPCDTPERLMTQWEADPAVVFAVAGGRWQDPIIAEAIAYVDATAISALPWLHPAAFKALNELDDLRACELVGPPGIGRQTLAAQFAAASEIPFFALDLKMLVESGQKPGELITRTLRQAAITESLAYFRDADVANPSDWDRANLLAVPYLRGVRHPTGQAAPVALKPLSIEARQSLWRSLTEETPPDRITRQRLTPSEILDAARHKKFTKPRRRPDHSLLGILPTPYEWDDLILSHATKAQLQALESQVRLRWSVYEEWGFAKLTHLGHGISALFGGPSGTGKTMAAQVLARSLGLDLLRVDLAGVVNKYIGETEKKLREVFDACEDSNAVLFFDEADALFGNRTQVKDAHDRFANIEIDYLLQRIERFDGVAILATNRRQDLDPAFVRRLRFVIEFLPPRPNERLDLWHLALLPTAPNGESIRGEIDFNYLSERLNMTGAEIKGTALNAAFLARADGTRISMQHVLAAAQREMAKQGLQLRIPSQERADA